ncbi:hypothetical protein [Pseudonocardia sp. H11422]|uniref:hypothetical protein n=1 Tax=Pseudonocardia sp. H11422 TaxID=2835866 RepID=UPI001BDC240E|nr:hypothetical protein [Pseudonocardia sp. H11422]
MAFRWRYLDPAGDPVDGPEETFDDQTQAEQWFGGVWEELRADGIDAVVLIGNDGTGDTEVYGPMSLQEG